MLASILAFHVSLVLFASFFQVYPINYILHILPIEGAINTSRVKRNVNRRTSCIIGKGANHYTIQIQVVEKHNISFKVSWLHYLVDSTAILHLSRDNTYKKYNPSVLL